MKRSLILLLVLLLFPLVPACGGPGADIKELSRKESLTADEAVRYGDALTAMWKDSLKTALQAEYDNQALVMGEYTMRIAWTIFGEKPASGRSLYISLHGGGGAPPRVNDGQWENQKRLYKPDEGVYLCPRAITDTWDLHFRPESDGFYERIIQMAQVFLDVDPDKVYIMGYSAGGDGVWRLAPRMADHWAAASMMAGHPGDVRLESLRNLPFMIWCGGEDAAYNRNAECARRIEEMDALQAADPEGYIHEGHIVPGKPHWMDLEDAAAVPWMAKYTRNPYPDKVVWVQGDTPKTAFYWLGVPASEVAKGKMLTATVKDNTVEILASDYSTVTVWLNDRLVNLDVPVRIVKDGTVLFEGLVKRTPANVRANLRNRADPAYLFPAKIEVKL